MSVVSICNRALSKIGTRSSIASITEGSAEAEACNLNFNPVRDQLLRAAHWGFARKFETAAVLKYGVGAVEFTGTVPSVWSSDYPPQPWLYTYGYPADALLIRYVTGQPSGSSATVGGVQIFSTTNAVFNSSSAPSPQRWAKGLDTDEDGNDIPVIWTNTYRAIFCYTKRVTNTDVWDTLFENAMVNALAGAIAMQLTGKVELVRMLYETANAAILNARQADANEGLTIIDTAPELLTARGLNYTPMDGVLMSDYGPMFELS